MIDDDWKRQIERQRHRDSGLELTSVCGTLKKNQTPNRQAKMKKDGSGRECKTERGPSRRKSPQSSWSSVNQTEHANSSPPRDQGYSQGASEGGEEVPRNSKSARAVANA
ncbi:hypothetical protein DPX16_14177 [Anabarilius grahami]|uniref:Uncharacterized protein n=1 Tax=Anabarilius grahami TaxID=495550 RepID=A0A3N0XFY6_ANAGA|nr:hypothetical protein DPX16_14177 [Anabarilius grahami]